MKDWTLRDGRPDDAAALADFWRDRYVETFGHLYRPADLVAFLAASYSPAQQLAELLDLSGAHRLAFDAAGALIGAASVGPLKLPVDPGPARSFELYRLYITESAKGAGLADALMAWAFDQADARATAKMYLGVFSENHRAKRFYARHGFSRVGGYEFIVGDARDAEDIMMRLMI
ncbi:MAG: GNAT family N-acetyltransferase [Caulobacterales bacterium]|jgi:ribosomal protein S18 acetylase RimI-like enzyme